MNTDRVFTAFDKDGNELLLYRKDSETYIDLTSDNNEIVPKDKIDLETLVFARNSIKLHKHMLASTIKRKYKKDRDILIPTEIIIWGMEKTIHNIEETPIDIGHGLYDIWFKWQSLNSDNINLYIFSRKVTLNNGFTYNAYINLYDKKEYIVFNRGVKDISYLYNFKEGMKYIYSTGLTLKDFCKEPVLEKKKVYEYANMSRKTKINI